MFQEKELLGQLAPLVKEDHQEFQVYSQFGRSFLLIYKITHYYCFHSGKDGIRGEDGEVGLPGVAGAPGKNFYFFYYSNEVIFHCFGFQDQGACLECLVYQGLRVIEVLLVAMVQKVFFFRALKQTFLMNFFNVFLWTKR